MKTFLLLASALIITACASSQVASMAVAPTSKVVLTSEAKWEQLNPARGDKSPKAATLWGDRNGLGPSGFLLEAVDGFRSPPHAHNVSYRGVVIRGLIHNDDPSADERWMPTGSFWTQPNGGVHITAAKGSSILAYIEIEEGPYLVLPVEKVFDSEDEPINMHESNIVWTDQPGTSASAIGPKVALLWGNPLDAQPSGSLVKLPAGFSGVMRSHGSSFRAVVIQGRPEHRVPGETEAKTLEPGSYFSSKGESVHQISSKPGEDCILYVRMEGELDVIPAQPEN
jgi:hypothetical protein